MNRAKPLPAIQREVSSNGINAYRMLYGKLGVSFTVSVERFSCLKGLNDIVIVRNHIQTGD